jgi:general stress protein YciG
MAERSNTHGKGKGNFGNSEQHRKAGQLGGDAVVEKYGANHMASIGSSGGKVSGGNFKNNRIRAAQAGTIGGRTAQASNDTL